MLVKKRRLVLVPKSHLSCNVKLLLRWVLSFSTVVLFLKTLLTQQSLDAPFTGGLGSYKLYVLVAHHIEKHLALGGSDRPGEVILSFLYRYGGMNDNQRGCQKYCTKLSQHVPLQGPDGASADLSNVFRLEECIQLFRQCWERLWEGVGSRRNNVRNESLLAGLICSNRLGRERKRARELLQASLGRLQQQQRQMSATPPPPRQHQSRPPPMRSSSSVSASNRGVGDLSSAEIAAGYGVDLPHYKPLAAQR